MEIIRTDEAPPAVGPYSQAVKEKGFVFTAGQVGMDPRTGKLVEGGVRAEARQTLSNLQAVLEAAGSSLGQVVRATVYLADIADWPAVNEVYAEAFGGHRPARSALQAGALPLGARVEVDVVASV